MPDDHRFKGNDGFDRHGDSAIAGMLGYFASRQDLEAYGYTAASAAEPDKVEMFVDPASGGIIPDLRGGLF